jgi:hypothetical protein
MRSNKDISELEEEIARYKKEIAALKKNLIIIECLFAIAAIAAAYFYFSSN